MTKNELITKVAEATGETKTLTTEIVDAVFETIANTVASGEEVRVHNFGAFKTKTQKGREGVIQMGARKGETYKTEDKTVVTFKASKEFADNVAGE